ncbi:MAG: FecR domain-containing protein [Verrucomicrobiia bacterium]
MKPVGCFSKLVACGTALAAVVLVCSAQAATGRAVVRTVKGTASYAEQGGNWMPLKTGQALAPGATVRTGVDGQVDLFLGDNGPDVHLFDSTTLGLDRLQIERTGADTVVETQLNLTSGTIRGEVKRLAAASKYEVKTPNAVFGIRGTKYQISANGIVHVIEGTMMVVYINPATQQMSTHTVSAGQTFVPPMDPGAPGSTPTVRPTRDGEIIPFEVVPRGPALVVVPQPEPFVQPVHEEPIVSPVE